ncbi:helix-turn-helix domain-containing protein [Neobacillus soli]|uniref:helix-turn-helix domain-containing protein n=1 Tax=Neobacillus soli TaxID=220688 RepID=UPI000BB84A47|nr:helix-turn-helix transcriptional regulator [Neobacillus soli]
MLGERIREIRKKKKMTLEVLAGEGLTKGMLSLIENNKANPSMESLAFIAKRLGVEVTELLEDISKQELRDVLEKAERLFNKETEKVTDKYRQLIPLIEPYVTNFTQGYESARLLDIYSRCLYNEKKDGWQDYSDRAAKMYDEMNLTAKRAGIGILRAMEKFIEHDYVKSLEIFLKERAEIESNHAYIDPITRVDLDYNESILYFAVGDSDSATRVMESAINFSKQHRIFYRIDDLYRLAFAQAMMTYEEEKKAHYSLKLKQYGDFAEDKQSLLFHDFFNVMSLNSEKHFVKALEIIDQYLSDPKMSDIYGFWYLLEKGKALYGLGQLNEAILCLDKVEIPSYAHHPFDLSMFYVMDSYKALCHLEFGAKDKALQLAKIAVENFERLPHTPFKDFATDSYNKIKLKMEEPNPS